MLPNEETKSMRYLATDGQHNATALPEDTQILLGTEWNGISCLSFEKLHNNPIPSTVHAEKT
jgi:hypothetical protein